MAEITATMVKQLRDDTGLGMMDCKKALEEASGDLSAAKDALRAKGLATAEKKAGRATSEGLVGILLAEDGSAGAMVEVQCETDFCARNEQFQKMVETLTGMAFSAPAGDVTASDEMASTLQDALAKIGENMSFARGVKLEAPQVGSYLHHNRKVGVLVALDKPVDAESLSGLCQHIAFSNPMGITPEDIPSEIVEKEKEIAKQQAVESGKPAEIAEKMVIGKVNKFLSQNALMEQAYVKDDKITIKELLDGATVTNVARYAVGEE